MISYRVPRILAAALCLACASRAMAAEPVLVSGNVHDARQPQAAVDEQGRIHVVFGSGDSMYYCRSDQSDGFLPPVEVPSTGKLSLGMRRGPRLAVTDDAVVVTAVAGELGRGRDGDLLAWRSTDMGETWDGPAAVTDSPAAAREGLHGMAAGPGGRVCSVWLDLRHGKTEIFAAVSLDHGATWG
jgi:hypothetical protein